MRAVLLSRYPRADRLPWKRRVAEGLLAAGIDVGVLFSRSHIVDQARAGVREYGAGLVKTYLTLRGGDDGEPEPTLAEWAGERGLPVREVRRLGSDQAEDALRELQPDLLVLVGADIVPGRILRVPTRGTINPHYGLLPGYRGMNVTEWSVLEGAPVGVTIHRVDEGIDTGDILWREEIAIDGGETFASLRVKHQEVAVRGLVETGIRLLGQGVEGIPQAPTDGRQYYVMHPAVRARAEAALAARVEGA